jgi:hypothetical protein
MVVVAVVSLDRAGGCDLEDLKNEFRLVRFGGLALGLVLVMRGTGTLTLE